MRFDRLAAVVTLALAWALATAILLPPTHRGPVNGRDPATWPPPKQGLVKFFSIEAHQEKVGLSLHRQRLSAGEARWDWFCGPLKGEMRLSIWPTVREARQILSGSMSLNSFGVRPFSPDGKMVGDISWTTAGGVLNEQGKIAWGEHTFIIYFCRRNVGCCLFIHPNRVFTVEERAAAHNELVRLARAIVQAIDSEEVVRSPSFVESPVVRVSVASKLRVKMESAIHIVVGRARSPEVSYSCFVSPNSYQGEGARITAPGEVHARIYTTGLGPGVCTVTVSDAHGMTRSVRRHVRVVPD